MADLYGTTAPTSGHEHEEISTFLNQLIRNSSSSSSSCLSFTSKYIHYLSSTTPDANSESGLFPQPEERHRIARSADPSGSVQDLSPGGFNFSNPVTTCVGAVDSDTYDSEKGLEASEVPQNNPGRPKPPSKRTRDAEVHNMSEKRRRSRINEKLKALQKVIPNSNKTDKASMLNEAIEYLKQLHLQVQMLTMRNGLSLHPMWLPGVLQVQPVQLPQAGIVFDEENGLLNTNRGTDTFSANEEGSVQTRFNISNQSFISNQPIAISSAANIISSTSETSFGLEPPLIQAHYGPFILSSAPKDLHDEGAPQLHLDMNFTGKNSSSAVLAKITTTKLNCRFSSNTIETSNHILNS